MRFGAAFWIQRTGWPELRDACVEAERAGFDSLWLDDHLLSDEGDWTDPKLEGWATLAAVAASTSRARVGLLVSANTFRNPGLVAKIATSLDHVSDGRLVLGIGGGWFAREHDAFGIDFGASLGDRLDRLDEAVMLIRRLLGGERVTHEGRFYQFHDAICEPRPLQQRLPILIGGSGPKKTLRTTARYADLWNGYGSAARIGMTSAALRERCVEEGRRFEDIDRTVTMDVVVRDDAVAARRAWDETTRIHGIEHAVGSDGSERGLTVGGSAEDVAAYLRDYAAIGVAEVIWIFRNPFDLETMSRLVELREAVA